MTYAILALEEMKARGLSCAGLIERHVPSYLAGTYLAADVMTLPGGYCRQCGEEYGYSSSRPEKCPVDGAAVEPYLLGHEGEQYSPKEILRRFYGRSHLTFGWHVEDEKCLVIRWEELPDYLGACLVDCTEFYPLKEQSRSYVLGWMAHVVSDALIKSNQPGLDLYLLNGTYTPENRPIQDLYSFHEVGKKELGLEWERLLKDLAETPVEPIQVHCMRMTSPRGKLAQRFPEGWIPQCEGLMLKVMAENRRFMRIYNRDILHEVKLHDGPDGPECNEEQSRKAKGKTWPEMIRICEEANFRSALDYIGKSIADLFEQVDEVLN